MSGRTEAFTLATRSLQGHLATGVGPRRARIAMDALGHSGPSYSHAHDLWPTWLLETDVVGFAAMALITLEGLVAAARTWADGHPLGVAGFAALTGFCVMSLVDNPANAERVAMTFWLVLGLVMADTRPGRLRPEDTAAAGATEVESHPDEVASSADEVDVAAMTRVGPVGQTGADGRGACLPWEPPTVPLTRRSGRSGRGDTAHGGGRRERSSWVGAGTEVPTPRATRGQPTGALGVGRSARRRHAGG